MGGVIEQQVRHCKVKLSWKEPRLERERRSVACDCIVRVVLRHIHRAEIGEYLHVPRFTAEVLLVRRDRFVDSSLVETYVSEPAQGVEIVGVEFKHVSERFTRLVIVRGVERRGPKGHVAEGGPNCA